MGVVKNIRFDQFPKQCRASDFGGVGTDVLVLFNYDTEHKIPGVIVRDDAEEPYVTIIKLLDGRYVLATECQYTSAK